MATVAFTSRTSKTISFTITAGGGETTFEVEVNRCDDFASDVSILKTALAAGANSVAGLPPGNRFYLRARATNGAGGAWSTPILVATSEPASPPAYAGFSIEPAILVVPEPIDLISCAQADAGSFPIMLANDDPLSVLRASGAAIAIEARTTGAPVDSIALLGTLANDDVTWRIRAADTQAALTSAPVVDTGVVPFLSVTNLSGRPHYHGFRRLSQLYTNFWWRIDLVNAAPTFIARHLVIGKARQSVNYSRGAGHEALDYGQMARTTYGAPVRTPGWRGRQVDFQLSWLSESEYETKWADLDQRVGQTNPVLALPNPKANAWLNDRIAYGCISGQRSENVRAAKWSKNLEIQSLY